jgi:Zn-finger protein
MPYAFCPMPLFEHGKLGKRYQKSGREKVKNCENCSPGKNKLKKYFNT